MSESNDEYKYEFSFVYPGGRTWIEYDGLEPITWDAMLEDFLNFLNTAGPEGDNFIIPDEVLDAVVEFAKSRQRQYLLDNYGIDMTL